MMHEGFHEPCTIHVLKDVSPEGNSSGVILGSVCDDSGCLCWKWQTAN